MTKQFAPACERNKGPILTVLREIFPPSGLVLEIGSGTGQHAAYFARQFPKLAWQPTDLPQNHPSIEAWRAETGVENLRVPLMLDLFHQPWPVREADVIVCINTIHIVSWFGVEHLFSGAGRVLRTGGTLYVYGPFRYAHRPLEPSNEQFNGWLKARDPESGVRDFEAVNKLAEENGLRLAGDRAMPANNRSIWWIKD